MKVINTRLETNMNEADRREEWKKMYIRLHTTLTLESEKKKKRKNENKR